MNVRVPFEFIGLGRRFREQITNADDHAVRTMISIFTPLARRADRSAVPRAELLQGAARQWRREMPSVGLLDSKIQLTRRDLHIRDVRVGGGTARATWNASADEPVVSILLVELHVAKGMCRLMVEVIALLSLHAIGRWHQRSRDNSEAALLADLARLAGAYGKIPRIHVATDNQKFFWPASNGQWAGSITERLSEVTGRQEQILNVRTFLPESGKDTEANGCRSWNEETPVSPAEGFADVRLRWDSLRPPRLCGTHSSPRILS